MRTYRHIKLNSITLFIALSLTASMHAANARTTQRAAETDIERRVKPCTACHGDQGRATPDGYVPRIAGKPTAYLFNQLVNFRDGYRQHEHMVYLVSNLPDSYLWELSEYFSGLHPPYQPNEASVNVANKLKLGKEMAVNGREESMNAKAIPSCMSCHGDNLTGALPAIPGLLGLPRTYISAQIQTWRLGNRRAAQPDCMATIAQGMTDAEIEAVALWLSTQALPSNEQPAPQSTEQLPLDCGSHLQSDGQP